VPDHLRRGVGHRKMLSQERDGARERRACKGRPSRDCDCDAKSDRSGGSFEVESEIASVTRLDERSGLGGIEGAIEKHELQEK